MAAHACMCGCGLCCVFQCSQRFSHSLDSLLMLRFSVLGKFPNLATAQRLSHQPGWLTIVTAVGGVSAQLRSLGILNQCE